MGRNCNFVEVLVQQLVVFDSPTFGVAVASGDLMKGLLGQNAFFAEVGIGLKNEVALKV